MCADTAFTSGDLRGEPTDFPIVFDVGVQVYADDAKIRKERYVTVFTPNREKKTSEDHGDDGDDHHNSLDEIDSDKNKKKKRKGLTRSRRCHF